MSSLRIGACALQIGHHVAWIPMKIGLPDFCAAANAAASKGCGSAANAGVTLAAAAAAAANRTIRRDSMLNPPGFDEQHSRRWTVYPAWLRTCRSNPVRAVPAGIPTVRCEMLLGEFRRPVLERRRGSIVPAVEKAEHGDHPDDLDDLVVAPVLAQLH